MDIEQLKKMHGSTSVAELDLLELNRERRRVVEAIRTEFEGETVL